MKVFVTGACGQLGYDVLKELTSRGHIPVASDLSGDAYEGKAEFCKLDITRQDKVLQLLEEIRPQAVIHCAAWTAVDAAEEDECRGKVRSINADGTRYLAKACKKLDIPMMYISTDYVFDGQGTKPWEPDCKKYAPLNVYGRTKLEGELAVAEQLSKFFIVRIAWVFGAHGNNFVKTMLRIAQNHDKITVVNDQIGTPTYTKDLARLLVDMIETDRYGYYHATNEGGYISWYEFALEIFKQAAAMGLEECKETSLSVEPVTTKEYGQSKAARPYNSRLDKSKLSKQGYAPLPDWKDALSRYLKEILSR
ncbi:dTDP-4-dehydrorhamnose reductase [Eubacterium oxidoreducens]|uniref:dTDP-4-dehydrorhamnose reductase n=1 Tax=Eubacterium oxidoreducens TaxID=1732 RepID=A0A1G6CB43_EUBOX|nr:dTDP-4-dehydrorhamnose reductase [Eubacterium oxidoreducens]SDB30096.1 dTDP-4-dehydrorhamnose reductase [Eubacterium oxidoreducens]